MRIRSALGWALCGVLVWSHGSVAVAKRRRKAFNTADEIHLSNVEYKKLDRLEAHALDKADAAYRKNEYRQAGAEYELFLREYPKSQALPYVLLRKARCLHMDDKRHDAIRQYNEVLDYFPNEVDYAAGALFFQGQAHWDNGDEALGMKCWVRMAKDKQYRTHRLAAGAINKLADHLATHEELESAIGYFHQVAVDFRSSNHQAAQYARNKVVAHHVRTRPNEPALRTFCAAAGVVPKGRGVPPAELAAKFEYWDHVRHLVGRHGKFQPSQQDQATSYYAYWAKQLDGKYADRDEYRLALAGFHLAATGEKAAWVARVDAQFARGKAGDLSRVIRWISVYGREKAKVTEYYAKLDFAKMTRAQVVGLIKVLYDRAGDAERARNAFGKLNLSKMPDPEKLSFARYLWHKDADLVTRLCQNFSDRDRGKHELLSYYHWRHNAKAGIPLAEALANNPTFATDAMWKKAELLEWSKQYAKAIVVFRQSSKTPENLWHIANCHERMGKIDLAVRQLREVESFFKDQRAQAALRIAEVYGRAKRKELCVAAYRRVLTKYPDAGESSAAHHQLERMGITRIRGGVRDGKQD